MAERRGCFSHSDWNRATCSGRRGVRWRSTWFSRPFDLLFQSLAEAESQGIRTGFMSISFQQDFRKVGSLCGHFHIFHTNINAHRRARTSMTPQSPTKWDQDRPRDRTIQSMHEFSAFEDDGSPVTIYIQVRTTADFCILAS